MGGTVFAQSDGVVGPHEDRSDAHQRRKPNRWPLVVGEDQEGAAVGAQRRRELNPVGDRRGSVLAHTKVQIAPIRVAGELLRGVALRHKAGICGDEGVVRAGQVSGASPQLGQHRCQGVNDLTGGGACGHGVSGGELRQVLRPILRQLCGAQPIQQLRTLGVALPPGLVGLLPLGTGLGAPSSHLPGVGEHLIVDVEVLLRVESEELLEPGQFLVTELGTVNGAGVLLLGGGPADHGAQRDQRGLGRLLLCGGQRALKLGDVFGVVTGLQPVHPLNVPAVCRVAGHDVLSERDVGVVLDRDLVVVPDHVEIAELLVSGQGRGLRGDALLEVAV